MHERIQHYLRAVVEAERDPVDAGAFVLYLHPHSDHPYLNYAIPLEGATGGDPRRLMAAARERGLVPRVEYVEFCFPWVEDALLAAGFDIEARLRLMTCERPAAPRTEAQIVRLERGSALVRDTIAVQRAAFGEPAPSDDDVARWGGRSVAALIGDHVVGGAAWTRVLDGMTEIVGVAVDEGHRHRGIGAALTAAAVREARSEGATLALLTPGDDPTARIYERAGFADASRMLHLRAPR